jgi:hypothetical protein
MAFILRCKPFFVNFIEAAFYIRLLRAGSVRISPTGKYNRRDQSPVFN